MFALVYEIIKLYYIKRPFFGSMRKRKKTCLHRRPDIKVFYLLLERKKRDYDNILFTIIYLMEMVVESGNLYDAFKGKEEVHNLLQYMNQCTLTLA